MFVSLRLSAAILALGFAATSHAAPMLERVAFGVDVNNRFFDSDRATNFRIEDVTMSNVTVATLVDKVAYDACVRAVPLDVAATGCERAYVKTQEAAVVEVLVAYDGLDETGGQLRFRFLADQLRPDALAAVRAGGRDAARRHFRKVEHRFVAEGSHVQCSADDHRAADDCVVVRAPTPQYVVSVTPL